MIYLQPGRFRESRSCKANGNQNPTSTSRSQNEGWVKGDHSGHDPLFVIRLPLLLLFEELRSFLSPLFGGKLWFLCLIHSNGNEGRAHEQKARCDRSHLASQKPGYSYPHDINIKKKNLVTMLLNYQPLVSPRASIFHELI